MNKMAIFLHTGMERIKLMQYITTTKVWNWNWYMLLYSSCEYQAWLLDCHSALLFPPRPPPPSHTLASLKITFKTYLGTFCEPQYSDSASHQLKHLTFMSSVAQPGSQSSKIPLGKIVLSTAAVNASNALCCLLQVTPSSISLCRPNSSASLDLARICLRLCRCLCICLCICCLPLVTLPSIS